VIGDCLRLNPPNQDCLETAMMILSSEDEQEETEASYTSTGISFLVYGVISYDMEFQLRMAILYVLECYLYRNVNAQIALLTAWLIPLPSPSSPIIEALAAPPLPQPKTEMTMMGNHHLLLDAIQQWDVSRKDPFVCWCSCVLLAHCLQSNQKAKILALHSIEEEEEEEEDRVSALTLLSIIVHGLMFSSQDQQVDTRVQLGFLSLLCIWLYECPEAVSEFLKESAHLQFVRFY
jgi:hypothetical protein